MENEFMLDITSLYFCILLKWFDLLRFVYLEGQVAVK